MEMIQPLYYQPQPLSPGWWLAEDRQWGVCPDIVPVSSHPQQICGNPIPVVDAHEVYVDDSALGDEGALNGDIFNALAARHPSRWAHAQCLLQHSLYRQGKRQTDV